MGNIKESFFAKALEEYKKRISAFARFSETEIKEEKTDGNETEASIARCLQAEGARILAKMPKKAFKIALCVEGMQKDSVQFAGLLGTETTSAAVVFVIGSSYGLSKQVKESCDYLLSFSKMTLPHRLMRVVLYEQIYRGLSINANRKYHK